MKKPERIGERNLWSLKKITKPGFYWIAGYFPEDKREMTSESIEPEEVYFNEFTKDDIKHYTKMDSIVSLMGYGEENFIWYGPIKPPPFKP